MKTPPDLRCVYIGNLQHQISTIEGEEWAGAYLIRASLSSYACILVRALSAALDTEYVLTFGIPP